MDEYNATDHVSPTVTSTRSLHEWLSSLAAQGMTAAEIGDTISDAMADATESAVISGRVLVDDGIPQRDEDDLIRALAIAGARSVDWTAIAAVFVERQQEIERRYCASADEAIGDEEVLAAACSVFGYDGEVQGVCFEHGQWWVSVSTASGNETWSMVDAQPGTTSVTHSETGRTYRVDFELVS